MIKSLAFVLATAAIVFAVSASSVYAQTATPTPMPTTAPAAPETGFGN